MDYKHYNLIVVVSRHIFILICRSRPTYDYCSQNVTKGFKINAQGHGALNTSDDYQNSVSQFSLNCDL